MNWRELTNAELREALRARSWRTDKLDGKSFTTLVRNRSDPTTAAFIDSVLNPSPSAEKEVNDG